MSNSKSLFDDNDEYVDDYHISETPILYPQSLEFYLNRGYIEVGNSVFESSTIETAMIGNKQVSIPVPGFATIMKKLHPNDTKCSGNIYYHDFKKTAFLYEKEELAEKEMPGSQINNVKISDTIVSSNSFDSLEQYKYLADIILNAPQDKEYCVYTIKKDSDINPENSVVVFLGVFKLDTISSLYNRKVILCKTKNIFNFK